MKNLTTSTGLRIAGRFIPPGGAVPGDVPGFDYEKAARKGMIEDQDGGDIVNPATTTGPAADANASADSQDSAELEELLRANRSLKEDLDAQRDEYQHKVQAARQDCDELQKQVVSLTAERDAAQKALEEGGVIPEDALARLEGVSGIGKALAEKALAALTGK